VLLPPGVQGVDANANELYVAMAHEGYQGTQDPRLHAELASSITQGRSHGVRVAKEAFPTPRGEGLRIRLDFTDPNSGLPLRLDLYLVPGNGNVLVLVAAGLEQLVTRRTPLLIPMAASLSVNTVSPARQTAPAAGGVSDAAPASRQWAEKLRGMKLTQLSSYSGMSSERYWYLHADGTYSHKGSSMVSIDVGPYGGAPTASASSIGRSAGQGTWRVVTEQGVTALVLRDGDGEQYVYRLEFAQGRTFLNGTRTFVTEP
jgi:hypothetical protein